MNKIVGYLILLSFLAGACSRSGNGDVSEFDTVIYQPRHADRFRILGSDGRKSTVIEVRNPWQGADRSEERRDKVACSARRGTGTGRFRG